MTEIQNPVYVLMLICKTMNEILGVYSTFEKAEIALKSYMRKMNISGCSSFMPGLMIVPTSFDGEVTDEE